MDRIDPTNVSTKDLAAFLGMTRDGVTRLNRQGVIQQNGIARGKYNLRAAVRAYVAYLRENKADSPATKLAKQRERKLSLQNDKTEDGLVAVADAAQVFATYASVFREFVMGQVPGIAARLAETNTPQDANRVLQGELQAISKRVTDDVLEAIGNET